MLTLRWLQLFPQRVAYGTILEPHHKYGIHRTFISPFRSMWNIILIDRAKRNLLAPKGPCQWDYHLEKGAINSHADFFRSLGIFYEEQQKSPSSIKKLEIWGFLVRETRVFLTLFTVQRSCLVPVSMVHGLNDLPPFLKGRHNNVRLVFSGHTSGMPLGPPKDFCIFPCFFWIKVNNI